MTPASFARGVLLSAIVGCATSPADDPEGSSETGSTTPTTTQSTTVDPSTTSATNPTSTTSATSTTASTDTSSWDDGESTESTGTPIELTPVFVALGDGGWTASSCDRGETWTTHAFSDEQGDHTQWTAFGGVAYGAGAFVVGLGWGGEGGHILRSTDGRTWEDLPASSFLEDGVEIGYAIYTSGVASIGDELRIFSQRVWSSTDGASWTSVDISLPPGSEQLRQLRGFPGVLVASVESQSGSQHPQGHFVVVSEDGGMTWSEGTDYVSGCSDPIQHWGDIEMVGDVIVVGTGDVCRSPDRGATWEHIVAPTGGPNGGQIRDLFHDDQGFVAVSGTSIFRSADGTAWTEVGDVGLELRAAAWAEGVYAGVASDGSSLVHSDDAVTWTAGVVDAPPQIEIYVRDFIGVAIETSCE